jgi:Na+-transporting methylmalonyl-CoA/oxaloacetate decarboxylase gamma subunit
MLDGLTLTVVGMLAVFAFLGVLVLAMALLQLLVARLPQGGPSTAPGVRTPAAKDIDDATAHSPGLGRETPRAAELATAAAAAAAFHAHRVRGTMRRSDGRNDGRSEVRKRAGNSST